MRSPLWILVALSAVGSGPVGAQRPSPVRLVSETEFDGGTVGFVPITGAVESASGRVAVLQQMDHRVLVFERDGRFAFAFGRKGAGPGEFTSLSSVGWTSDSLWIFDRSTLRISVVSPAGKLVRTMALTELQATPRIRALAGNGRVAAVLGLTSDVRVLARYGDVRADNEHLVVISNRRQIALRLAGIPRSAGQVSYEIGNNRGGTSISFTQPTLVTAASSAPTVLIVSGPSATATTTSVDLLVAQATADTVLARRLDLDTRPIPATIRDSVITRQITSLRGPAVAAVAGAANAAPSRAGMPPEVVAELTKIARERTPRFYPAVTRAQLGTDNSIWLERLTEAGLREYRVLNADGSPAFTIAVRANQTLMSPSLSHALLVELDADDVPSLRRVRFVR